MNTHNPLTIARNLIGRLPDDATSRVHDLVNTYATHPIAHGPLKKLDDAIWRYVVTHRPATSPHPTADGASPAATTPLTPLNATNIPDAVFAAIHWGAQPAVMVTAGCTWVATQALLARRTKTALPAVGPWAWWRWGITPTQAATTIALIISAQASSTGLKKLISRERPPEMFRLAVENAHSFPSGHMIASTAACGILSALWAASKHGNGRSIPGWVPAAMAAWCALVGYDRLYMGVHWFSDLIGGATVGLAWSGLAWKILPRR